VVGLDDSIAGRQVRVRAEGDKETTMADRGLLRERNRLLREAASGRLSRRPILQRGAALGLAGTRLATTVRAPQRAAAGNCWK